MLIRPLRAEDAEKLTRCFERCYGDSYVADFFYHPEKIRSRMAAGQLRSIVAVDPAGEIVGHMALTLRHARALTADAGNTVVDPRYRNQQLAARLGAGLIDLTRDAGLVGFHHYPTTVHPIMQKLAVQGGGIETGIMLHYIPAETDYGELGEGDGKARPAVVVVYQPISAAPAREVYLPLRYEQLLLWIYDQTELARPGLAPASVADGATRLESSLEARRGLLRIQVGTAGADLKARVKDAINRGAADVIQADLRLSDPGVSLAVDALHRLGFFYCALLPEYDEGDVLRLQHLPHNPGGFRPPVLATTRARVILDHLTRDHAQVLAEGDGSRALS